MRILRVSAVILLVLQITPMSYAELSSQLPSQAPAATKPSISPPGAALLTPIASLLEELRFAEMWICPQLNGHLV